MSATADSRFENLLRRLVTIVLVITSIGTAGLGVLFLVTAIGEMAPYGDARQYLAGYYLEEGLHSNRGVFYPQFVWAWTHHMGLPVAGLHALQLFLLWAALGAFMRRLGAWARCPRLTGWPVALALSAFAIASSPLLLHHSVAVMPDALATSWLLLVTMGVVDGVRAGDGAARLRCDRRTVFMIIAGLGTAFIRNEHAYIALALCGLTGLLYLLVADNREARLGTLVRCAVFMVCVGLSMTVNSAIQGRHPLEDGASVPRMLAVNRLSYGALPDITEHLQPQTRKLFGLPNRKVNRNPTNFPIQVRELLETTPRKEIDAALDDIVQTTIEHDWHRFSTRYYRDWVNQLLPSLTYPLAIHDGRPHTREASWTFTCTVKQGGDRIVHAWVGMSLMLFFALLAAAGLGARHSVWRLTPPLLAGTLVIIFLNATLYATLTPLFNPRYSLPAAAVGHALLVLLAAAAMFRPRAS